MTVKIQISENGRAQNYLFQKIFDEESVEWSDFYQSLERQGTFSSPYLRVTRTDTWNNLAKDLLLPSIYETGFKTKNLVQKIFVILRDVFTFLPRLLSLFFIPKKELHPLHQYLKTYHADERLLNTYSVFVKMQAFTSDENVTRLALDSRYNILYIPLPKHAVDYQGTSFWTPTNQPFFVIKGL